jgi:Transposase domain (DUF772)
MLGRREAQTSIFDSDQRYLGHVGEKTFFGYLARHRHELFRGDDFADSYRTDWGRPSVAPSVLCTALVLQHYDGCSDQEAAESAAYDQRWKVALGTGEIERPFAKSTLQLFRAQLIVHEKARSIFEASLAAARRVGRLKSEGRMRAALDTTNILGRGAVRDNLQPDRGRDREPEPAAGQGGGQTVAGVDGGPRPGAVPGEQLEGSRGHRLERYDRERRIAGRIGAPTTGSYPLMDGCGRSAFSRLPQVLGSSDVGTGLIL